MKPTEINVSIKFVKNLGNYQSFTAEAGITAVIEPGESAQTAFDEAFAMAKSQVRAQASSLQNIKEACN